MKLRFTTLALASLLAVNANAITVSWGTHDDPIEQALGQFRPIGLFDDTYTFTLPTSIRLFNTTVANNLSDDGNITFVRHISNGMVFLFDDDFPAAIGSFAFSGVTGSISHPFGALDAGDYHYQVKGDADGVTGGSYALTSAVTAVPEPEIYALLLAGLGVVGFLAKRRKRID